MVPLMMPSSLGWGLEFNNCHDVQDKIMKLPVASLINRLVFHKFRGIGFMDADNCGTVAVFWISLVSERCKTLYCLSDASEDGRAV